MPGVPGVSGVSGVPGEPATFSEPLAPGTPPTSKALPALPSVDALRSVLAARGMEWSVEGRDRLAILVPTATARGVEREIDPATRRWLVQEAQRAGFSHGALEIDDESSTTGSVSPTEEAGS